MGHLNSFYFFFFRFFLPTNKKESYLYYRNEDKLFSAEKKQILQAWMNFTQLKRRL